MDADPSLLSYSNTMIQLPTGLIRSRASALAKICSSLARVCSSKCLNAAGAQMDADHTRSLNKHMD